MKLAQLFSMENNHLRNQMLENAFRRFEKSMEEENQRLIREIKIRKAGMKSFCQDKRNFNQLKISATQANCQSILGGFWIN